jgi:hypothetical protein
VAAQASIYWAQTGMILDNMEYGVYTMAVISILGTLYYVRVFSNSHQKKDEITFKATVYNPYFQLIVSFLGLLSAAILFASRAGFAKNLFFWDH